QLMYGPSVGFPTKICLSRKREPRRGFPVWGDAQGGAPHKPFPAPAPGTGSPKPPRPSRRALANFFLSDRSRSRARSETNPNRDGTFLSACEGFDSSVIAAVEPTPVQRCVLYTFADVPLNAGRLVVSQVASTARQEHQCRSHKRGFDDSEHPRDPLSISSR